MNRRRTVFVASLALVLALASTPLAAGGKGGGNAATASYNLSLAGGPYTFGGEVSASTTVPAELYPWISMECSQNGVVVGTASHAAFPGGAYYGTPFSLGPTRSWSGGAADCTFSVVHVARTRVVTDASVSIHVDA